MCEENQFEIHICIMEVAVGPIVNLFLLFSKMEEGISELVVVI